MRSGTAASGQTGEGTTTLAVDAQGGDPLLLVVEGVLAGAEEPVELIFSAPLREVTTREVSVRRESGSQPVPEIDVDTDGRALTVRPVPAWEPGARYVLVLDKRLFAASGSGQDNVSLELPFRVADATDGNPVFDGLVADAEVAGDVLLLAARDQGLRAFDVSDPGLPGNLGYFGTAGGVAAVASDGFGLVGALCGDPATPTVLRLLALADLTTPNQQADELDSLGVSSEAGASAGALRAETVVKAAVFTIAEPEDGITVLRPDPDAPWTELRLAPALLAANHPVILLDGVTERVLWSATVPDPVPPDGMSILPGDLATPVAESRPLRLRAHRETIWYAFASAGRAVAARTVYHAGAPPTLEAVAVLENADLRAWLRGQGTDATCRKPGPEDPIYVGRVVLAPRDSARPVLLAASPYDGLLGVIPQSAAFSLAPNLVQCLRSNLGTRLADVAAARWEWEDESDRHGDRRHRPPPPGDPHPRRHRRAAPRAGHGPRPAVGPVPRRPRRSTRSAASSSCATTPATSRSTRSPARACPRRSCAPSRSPPGAGRSSSSPSSASPGSARPRCSTGRRSSRSSPTPTPTATLERTDYLQPLGAPGAARDGARAARCRASAGSSSAPPACRTASTPSTSPSPASAPGAARSRAGRRRSSPRRSS